VVNRQSHTSETPTCRIVSTSAATKNYPLHCESATRDDRSFPTVLDDVRRAPKHSEPIASEFLLQQPNHSVRYRQLISNRIRVPECTGAEEGGCRDPWRHVPVCPCTVYFSLPKRMKNATGRIDQNVQSSHELPDAAAADQLLGAGAASPLPPIRSRGGGSVGGLGTGAGAASLCRPRVRIRLAS
jgi:hypothetical protein